MRWLVTGLCVIALAISPAAASANTEGEAMSPEPIVIAYIPEHLQHRVPGHQHKHQAAPKSPSEGASAESGLSRRGKIGIGVGVSIALLGIGLAIGAAAMTAGFEFQ
jgi:hypothetical protein